MQTQPFWKYRSTLKKGRRSTEKITGKKEYPESSYIDSAVRHYLKWLRGDNDERHDRAFVWNIMCLIWTHEHITDKPATDKKCVETDCYFNDDCICTTPFVFAVNPTAGKECINYCEAGSHGRTQNVYTKNSGFGCIP